MLLTASAECVSISNTIAEPSRLPTFSYDLKAMDPASLT